MIDQQDAPKLTSENIALIRRMWTSSREQDEAAQKQLLEILLRYETVDAFLRGWSKAKQDRLKSDRPKSKSSKRKKPVGKDGKSAPTAWERARSTLGTGGARVISGGLPSLGKRSR